MPQGSGYPKDPSQGGMMLGPGGVMGAADHMGYAMGMQGHYTMAYPGERACMHEPLLVTCHTVLTPCMHHVRASTEGTFHIWL